MLFVNKNVDRDQLTILFGVSPVVAHLDEDIWYLIMYLYLLLLLHSRFLARVWVTFALLRKVLYGKCPAIGIEIIVKGGLSSGARLFSLYAGRRLLDSALRRWLRSRCANWKVQNKTKKKKMEKWKKHAPKRTYERESDREKEQDRRADWERALSLSLFFERKSVSAKSALSELNYFYSGERGVGLKCYKNCWQFNSPHLTSSLPVPRTHVSVCR